ncbi:hypothetical protein E2C01_039657 [Portunus trituberculatus]|uniref:Uncharacterized protein n=1 Tax=Portunus trituberculatus TaxID=210409 RepID=A0A5B7FHE7_PORTR|nr:hypothetical protein [Portunus trituberculatus]
MLRYSLGPFKSPASVGNTAVGTIMASTNKRTYGNVQGSRGHRGLGGRGGRVMRGAVAKGTKRSAMRIGTLPKRGKEWPEEREVEGSEKNGCS